MATPTDPRPINSRFVIETSSPPPIDDNFIRTYYMMKNKEEFFNKRPKKESISAAMRIFGNCWESMSDADKAPYFEEASKRNVLRDAYNKWKSMSGTEKAPFLAKAKAPYSAKLAMHKRMRSDKNWDEDKEFDTFGFFIFWEESENKSAEGAKAHFCLFCEWFIEEYKKNHPEDQRLVNVNVKDEEWWALVPEEILHKAMEAWNEMSDSDKAPYALRAEQRRNEALHAYYALTIYRNDYKKNNPKVNGLMVTACDKAWETMSAEEKTPYFGMAKMVLDSVKN